MPARSEKTESLYTQKNSIYTDVVHKFIRRYAVTPSNIHDSQLILILLDSENNITLPGLSPGIPVITLIIF